LLASWYRMRAPNSCRARRSPKLISSHPSGSYTRWNSSAQTCLVVTCSTFIIQLSATGTSLATPPSFEYSAHIPNGGSHYVLLCGSDHWFDGVRVAAPVSLANPVPRVSYKTHTLTVAPKGMWARLPYAPIIEEGQPLRQATAVSLAHTQVDRDGVATTMWSAGLVNPSATPCAVHRRRLVSSAPTSRGLQGHEGDYDELTEGREEEDDDSTLDAGDDDWWQDELAQVEGVVCYQLRVDGSSTAIEIEPAYTPAALLDDWGGAYALVFGCCSLALYVYEKLRGKQRQRSSTQHSQLVEPPAARAL